MISSIKYCVPILLIGLLMGPFSSFLFINIFHFPIVAPEIIFIFFFIFFYKKYGISFDRKISLFYIFALWMFFFIIALLWGRWSVSAILSTARSFLILGLFYEIGKKIHVNDDLLKFILVLSIGSLIGWCIKSYLNFITLAFLRSDEESVVYGNMLAIVYAISISLIVKSNYLTILLIFLLNVFISFTSALRRQIVAFLLTVFMSLLLITIKNKKINYLILTVLFVVPITFALPQIESTIAANSPNMHARIFDRSQNLLEGNLGNSEESRIKNQNLIFEDFFELIIPHGYVSQQTGKDKGTGIFNDIPIYMLAYTFGVIPLFLYLILFVCKLCKALRFFIRKNNIYYGVIFIVGVVVFFLHFIDSQIFTVSYTTPFTGLTLGLLFRKSLITSKSHYKI